MPVARKPATTLLRHWPLARQLGEYRVAWLKPDLAAGISVAAVSLPSAVAYPAIAGLPIEVGLYATIFAMIGYALVGPSRRLMVGPDTATCIILASALAAVGVADQADRVSLTLLFSFLVGVLCLLAGALRLGFIANFLSRPMLTGFLAGIALSLIVGQIKRMTGVEIASHGLLRPVIELGARLGEVHLPTLAVGLVSFVFLRVMRVALPSVPAAPVAIVVAILTSFALDLPARGVAVIGEIPPVAFTLSLPHLENAANVDLWSGAIGIMIVGFGSGIVTARSFAMKDGQGVDADKELFGFGAANILSGLFGGFPVSASDSRTAVNYGIGGKTQLTALVAAGILAAALLLMAHALSAVPQATLGAILISAAIDLIDIPEFRTIRKLSKSEFRFALLTMLLVAVVGVLKGILIAVAATLIHLLWGASNPRLAMLGRVPGSPGLFKLHRYPEADAIPGLTIVVLQSALIFFNAEAIQRKLLRIADAAPAGSRWFVLDAAAVNTLDSTGLKVLEEIRAHLARRNVAFGIADLNSRSRRIVERSGLADQIGKEMLFPSAEAAVAAYEARARSHLPPLNAPAETAR
ncbi:MAG TPA: SulP family inorganic anion transporter [Candidatus Binatia bacterium]|nr:SulP family inorganic anion transporter [Candidatus Binatia bacterium]